MIFKSKVPTQICNDLSHFHFETAQSGSFNRSNDISMDTTCPFSPVAFHLSINLYWARLVFYYYFLVQFDGLLIECGRLED